jgi:anti-sigma regulatory factor (Ser/Thr protein kinase)/CheY-like chemotaxis protein
MGVHVLLVQDRTARTTVLHRALYRRGYSVDPCSDDGERVVSWARQHQPDLVVLTGRSAQPTSKVCLTLKLQHATNLLPVIQVRFRNGKAPCGPCLRVEPDSELDDPSSPGALSTAIERAFAAREEARREATLAEVRFALPSDADGLEEFLRHLTPWLAGCGLGAYSVQQMTLAVREVGANAIEWGHRCQRERVVAVSCRLDPDKISIMVRDSGPGFDRRNLPHAARPGDPLSHLAVRAKLQLRDGGFGILMASGLVDHLCYNDVGNEAQLLKYLPAGAQLPVTALGEPVPASLQR